MRSSVSMPACTLPSGVLITSCVQTQLFPLHYSLTLFSFLVSPAYKSCSFLFHRPCSVAYVNHNLCSFPSFGYSLCHFPSNSQFFLLSVAEYVLPCILKMLTKVKIDQHVNERCLNYNLEFHHKNLVFQ